MSFVRPELIAAASRNQAHLWAAAGLLSGALIAWRGIATMAPILTIFGGGLLTLTVVLWIAHRQRAAFLREVSQPGVVEINEAQITYFSPEVGGGVVDRDALIRIDLVSGGDGRARWALYHSGGPPVSIPLAAEGADALIDFVITLPGVRVEPALAALNRARVGVVPVWERSD